MRKLKFIISGEIVGIFLFCALTLSLNEHCHAQQAEWLWGQRGGGSSSIGGDEEAKDIAVDDSGNVYVCGNINKSFAVIFDTLQVPSYGEKDMFLAKYSCDGKLLWIKTGGNRQGHDLAVSVLVDTIRDVIYFSGSLRSNSNDVFKFANDTVITQSHNDFFLMQLDVSGNMNWLTVGSTFSRSLGIALNQVGNIYALIGSDSGYFLPNYYLNSPGIYLIKFLNTGVIGMSKKIDDGGSVGYADLEIDEKGNLYTGGYFEDTAVIAGAQIISKGYSDAFIAKFDSVGDLIWLKTEGQAMNVAGIIGLSLKGEDELYITGSYGGSGTFNWAGTILPNGGGTQAIFGKYDSNGNMKWIYAGSSLNVSSGRDVIAGQNLIHFTGDAYGDFNLNSKSIKSVGQRDPYIASFGSNGILKSLNQIKGGGVDIANCIGVGENENFYIAGSFSLDLWTANDTLLTKGGNNDMFVAKYGIPECFDTTTVDTIDTTDTTGIFERYALLSQPIHLFPNPNNGTFTLKIDKDNVEGTLTIMNTLGQQVYSSTVNGKGQSTFQTTLNLKLPTGIYLVMIQAAEVQYVQKIMIE